MTGQQISRDSKYGFEFPFKPDPLVKKALRFIKGSRRKKLLDVGCGEGADSVFYAKHGYRVTAIDRNETYLNRFRAYRTDHKLSSLRIRMCDATAHRYPRNAYDVISCILVLCCMKRTEFDAMLTPMKRSVKPGGFIVMSSRNYLDPELNDYMHTQKMIEPNTFRHKEGCCKFVYFIEKGRLREVFSDFEILYYYEGYAPCKYNQHPKHGDSYIICRRKK